MPSYVCDFLSDFKAFRFGNISSASDMICSPLSISLFILRSSLVCVDVCKSEWRFEDRGLSGLCLCVACCFTSFCKLYYMIFKFRSTDILKSVHIEYDPGNGM